MEVQLTLTTALSPHRTWPRVCRTVPSMSVAVVVEGKSNHCSLHSIDPYLSSSNHNDDNTVSYYRCCQCISKTGLTGLTGLAGLPACAYPFTAASSPNPTQHAARLLWLGTAIIHSYHSTTCYRLHISRHLTSQLPHRHHPLIHRPFTAGPL